VGLWVVVHGRLRGAGDAEEVALGIGELAAHHGAGRALGTQHAGSAEPLGPLKRCLDVRHAHVEQDAALVAFATGRSRR
jgi:hypothetical protein